MDELEYIKRLIAEGKREEAINELRKFLESNPRNISALFQLAFNTDNIHEEEECYRKILKIDRSNQNAKKYLKFLNTRMELSTDEIIRILPPETSWGKVLYVNGKGSYQESAEFYAPKSDSKIADDRDDIWFLAIWEDNKHMGKGIPDTIEFLKETGFPFGLKIEARDSDFQHLPSEDRYVEISIIGNELPPYLFQKRFSTMGVLSKSIRSKETKSIVLGAYSSDEEDLRELVNRCGFVISDVESKIKLNEKTRERIPEDVQIYVWRRDEGKCVICGSQENLEFDHIIPFSKGGSNTARNIQILCEKCNRSKSNKIGG